MTDPKKQAAPEPQLQTRQEETAAIAGAVAQKTLEAVLPSLIANLQKGQALAPPTNSRYTPRESKRRCDTCGWFLKDPSKSECDDHEYAVIYPTNEDYGPHFVTHGLKLSGVRYCSEGPGHHIPVPVGAKSTLLRMVAEYEQAEKEMRLGRQRKKNVGTVSPGGARVNPTSAGWE